MNDFESNNNLSDTPMRDVGWNIAITFIVLFFLATLVSQIPKKKEENQIKIWGDIMITIEWPDKKDIDVDLWAKSPDDPLPVGYSRTRGSTLALLKDITGLNNNPTGRMREVIFGDGTPDGRYTVNVHLYRNASSLTNVPVDAKIFMVDGSNVVKIVKKRVFLKNVRDEITIANFNLKGGKLLGKPDDKYVPLRVVTGGGP
ncbi:MAG: hypothetical protein UV48_C0003G0006 [Candidatus Azambacteria bacterium GW2011_GWA2_42_9]|uniref:Uncharacterized protein n=3 Tax=Candidatus Azamiibacteriota TaxID=1752741 RepID=A0A0G0ZCD8_9BACT|nr:MAG: hypothetical protein UV07_C0005G0030 [Candidatus Azambacteria bacterium GW2011_GWB1_42_17]KKS46400.1 MAG: hypothetical protein UV10_C0003G0029 [Candidatus Azambacteria bacterium GW2011_GWA1_42_19]KKS75995.1 MAG: hypothetical protein UV48_C0003G0006 [Candidatus Azambacteria bacterium GW2011_GWA2_42_9]KKS88758.1 MAG: hypothetical protein UV62_C0002G0006 [Parcubacteria group bacterium GW2011_GWC1_43_11]